MPDLSNAAGLRLPDKEAWLDYHKAEHAELRERLLDLKVGLDRVPKEVTDDNASVVVTFIKQCKAASKDAETARKKITDPIRELGAETKAVFDLWVDPVADAIREAEKRLTAYQTRKRAEEAEAARLAKEKAEAEAKAAREAAEAERRDAEAKARAAEDDAAREAAARAQEVAAQAEAEAERRAKAAEKAGKAQAKGAVGGEYGAAASHLRGSLKHRVVDIDQVPRLFLTVDEAAVREYVADCRRNNEEPAIPGIEFYREERAVVR